MIESLMSSHEHPRKTWTDKKGQQKGILQPIKASEAWTDQDGITRQILKPEKAYNRIIENRSENK